jgi:hypothetical protein
MKNIVYIKADIVMWHDILIAHLTTALIVGLATCFDVHYVVPASVIEVEKQIKLKYAC